MHHLCVNCSKQCVGIDNGNCNDVVVLADNVWNDTKRVFLTPPNSPSTLCDDATQNDKSLKDDLDLKRKRDGADGHDGAVRRSITDTVSINNIVD
jgi:hypothetical protein